MSGFSMLAFNDYDEVCSWCDKAGTLQNPVYEHDMHAGFSDYMHSHCWREYAESLDLDKVHDYVEDKIKSLESKTSQKIAMVESSHTKLAAGFLVCDNPKCLSYNEPSTESDELMVTPGDPCPECQSGRLGFADYDDNTPLKSRASKLTLAEKDAILDHCQHQHEDIFEKHASRPDFIIEFEHLRSHLGSSQDHDHRYFGDREE